MILNKKVQTYGSGLALLFSNRGGNGFSACHKQLAYSVAAFFCAAELSHATLVENSCYP